MNYPTYHDAAARLPADAQWVSSFGNGGEPGYTEFWRTPDGTRYTIDNGAWDAITPVWSCRQLAAYLPPEPARGQSVDVTV